MAEPSEDTGERIDAGASRRRRRRQTGEEVDPALAEPAVERTLSELPSELPPGTELIVISEKPGAVHWGVNGWKTPASALRPAGTVRTSGPAVETPLRGPGPDGRIRCHLAS